MLLALVLPDHGICTTYLQLKHTIAYPTIGSIPASGLPGLKINTTREADSVSAVSSQERVP